jgi:predicted methyltransferase
MYVRQTRIVIAIAGLCWLLSSCVAGPFDRRAAIAAALAAPDRPTADTERDADRHAADLLIFSRVRPGERVLDIGSGGGYFTRLLSSMVGPKGQVAAHDAPSYVKNIAAQREALLASRPNIVGMLTPFEGLEGQPGSYDLVTIMLMYHDIVRLGDRVRMNEQIFRLLKPGGRVLVVDHAAPNGSGLRDAGTLHRIDPQLVRSEFEAAGFRLNASSSVLANPEDDMTRPPFDPRVRWHTNQFVLLFTKPAAK